MLASLSAAQVALASDAAPVLEDAEAPRARVAVELKNVSRTFPGRPPVRALSGLSVTMLEGQVTGLLGQNGAGKSTAIGILTGLFPPSSGSATVFGMDVATEMARIRARTGVCPQHDLLYDSLTVEEHLQLFGLIKGVPPAKLDTEGRRWLQEVGLASKLGARAGTLSGGQKRKLSVAVAMIGEPSFVLLDEPTAGMDPESRRAIWSLVLAARAGRSIVLTTHFMDEADALADRIAIIAKGAEGGGTLRVQGTALQLKTQYGAGYHLRFVLQAEHDADGLGALITRFVPEAKEEERTARELSYLLPQNAASRFGDLFDALKAAPPLTAPADASDVASDGAAPPDGEVQDDPIHAPTTCMAAYGALSLGLALPTLQEVFLQIVETEASPSAMLSAADIVPLSAAPPLREPAAASEEAGEADDAWDDSSHRADEPPVRTRRMVSFSAGSRSAAPRSEATSDAMTTPLQLGAAVNSSEAAVAPIGPPARSLTLGLALDQFSVSLRLHWWRFIAEPPVISSLVSIALAYVAFGVSTWVHDGGGSDSRMNQPSMPIDATPFAGLSAGRRGESHGYSMPFAPATGPGATWLIDAQSMLGYHPTPVGEASPGNLTDQLGALMARLATFEEAAFGAFALPSGPEAALFEGCAIVYNNSYTNALPTYTRLMLQSIVGAIDPDLRASRWWSGTYEGMVYNQSAVQAMVDSTTCDNPSDCMNIGTNTVLRLVVPPLVLNIAVIMFTLKPVVDIVQDRESKCKHQMMLMGCDIRIYWLAYTVYFSLFAMALFVIPVLTSAAATATVSDVGVSAIALLAVPATASINLFAFVISFLFRNKEQATGFYTIACRRPRPLRSERTLPQHTWPDHSYRPRTLAYSPAVFGALPWVQTRCSSSCPCNSCSPPARQAISSPIRRPRTPSLGPSCSSRPTS